MGCKNTLPSCVYAAVGRQKDGDGRQKGGSGRQLGTNKSSTRVRSRSEKTAAGDNWALEKRHWVALEWQLGGGKVPCSHSRDSNTAARSREKQTNPARAECSSAIQLSPAETLKTHAHNQLRNALFCCSTIAKQRLMLQKLEFMLALQARL